MKLPLLLILLIGLYAKGQVNTVPDTVWSKKDLKAIQRIPGHSKMIMKPVKHPIVYWIHHCECNWPDSTSLSNTDSTPFVTYISDCWNVKKPSDCRVPTEAEMKTAFKKYGDLKSTTQSFSICLDSIPQPIIDYKKYPSWGDPLDSLRFGVIKMDSAEFSNYKKLLDSIMHSTPPVLLDTIPFMDSAERKFRRLHINF